MVSALIACLSTTSLIAVTMLAAPIALGLLGHVLYAMALRRTRSAEDPTGPLVIVNWHARERSEDLAEAVRAAGEEEEVLVERE